MKNTRIMLIAGLLIGAMLTVPSAHAQVSIGSNGIAFPDGTLQTTGIPGTYAIGDIGPAGGFVFYVTADGLHGLEAAPADHESLVQWGCFGTDIPGAEGTAIGTGARNTDEITPYGCSTAGIAAAVAAAYISPSGYFDWYLPSKDELNLMYQNLHVAGLGGFVGVVYWSSSEIDVNNAWDQFFGNGVQFVDGKNFARRVRAVRAF